MSARLAEAGAKKAAPAPISRNKEHELIMTCLYDALTYVDMDEPFAVEKIIESVYQRPYQEVSLFARTTIVKALVNLNAVIALFQERMPKWRFARLNRLERAILIMSYAQKKYVEDVDKGVVIDVAVRLAKRYLGADDYKFVNAILDKVL